MLAVSSQLLETCALFGTLIGDPDGVYDPSQYNDRLLLGLKGTMSEAELYLIKQRMLAGKRAKAARGELGKAVPMGYTRHPSGQVIKDPDEQAQATIELVFEQFDRHGTIHGLLRYLVEHQGNRSTRVARRAPSPCSPRPSLLGTVCLTSIPPLCVFSHLSRFSAIRLRIERFSAPSPFLTRHSSSRKATSNTQCSPFSTDQCRRRAGRKRSAVSARLLMYQ